MANIKSAKKRILVTDRKTLRNKSIKSALKTQLKKFDAAEGEEKEQAFRASVSCIDKAASKGILHPNKAAHMKSQLAKQL